MSPRFDVHYSGLTLVAVLLVCTFAARIAEAQLLGPRNDLDTGPNPRTVVVADLDADGHLDLVATVSGANQVAIFRGVGDGTFLPRFDLAVGPAPRGLAVADWNSDGKLDLLVGAAGDTTITLFTGDGLGGFSAAGFVKCPAIPEQILVADVSGDGRLDAVVAADDAAASLFDVRGTESHGFAAPRTWIADPAVASLGAFVGPIDGVAGNDVYVSNRLGPARLLRANGGGGFLAAVVVGGSAAASGVAGADFDGDGDQDAVETAPTALGGPALRFLVNGPTGTFGSPLLVPVAADPVAPVVADFNLDGKLDAACVSRTAASLVASLRGCLPGDAVFASVDLDPRALALGDFDEDGDPDFVTANAGGASLTLRTNGGAPPTDCAPSVVVTPPSYDFGIDGIGVSEEASIRVRNVGEVPLALGAITVGTDAFTLVSVPTGPIVANGFADVVVRAQRNTFGITLDTLRIATNDPLVPVATVPLVVEVRQPYAPSLNAPDSVIFAEGPLGTAEVKAVPIQNLGESTLSLGGYSFSNPEFEFASPAPLAILAQTGSWFSIRYRRTTLGSHTGTLTFQTTDPNRPVATITLTGSTRPLGASPSAPASLNFGADVIGVATELQFSVTNQGELPCSLLSALTTAPTKYVITQFVPGLLPAGQSQTVRVRYDRPALGNDSATLLINTNAPLKPSLSVSLSGSTIPGEGQLQVDPTTLDFGAAAAGIPTTRTVRVRNLDTPPLTIHGLRTSSPRFRVVSPTPPVGLQWFQSAFVTVSFDRPFAEAAEETLFIDSSDPVDPTFVVRLSGVASEPPLAAVDASTLGPVTLAPGGTATRSVRIFNDGTESSLAVAASAVLDSTVDAAGIGWDVAQGLAPGVTLDPISFPQFRIDGDGHGWDILDDGRIGVGDPGAFAGGFDWLEFPPAATGLLADGGRTIVFEGAAGALRLERRVHVSPTEGFVRYLDTVENTGAAPAAFTLRLRSDIDLASFRLTQTSSGDAVVQTTDDWVVIQDDITPVVAHVVAGPGSSLRPSLATLTNGFRTLRHDFPFALAPGAAASILHYGVQAADLPGAIGRANSLQTPFGPALSGLSGVERARILNFAVGSPFLLPDPSFSVDTLSNRTLPVVFEAPAGGGESRSYGTLRIQTSDPAHPLFVYPLELRVEGTSPDVLDGTGPGDGPALALAARFVPNPAVGRGLRLAYALPAAGEARFELYDVRGRRIASQVLPEAAAGPGTLEWSGGVGGHALAPGVYWTRLTHAGRSVVTKGVVLR